MRAAMQPTEPSSDREPPPIAEVSAAFPQLEILSLIGQGGMGWVFKARQPKLNRIVALKLLPASLAERDAAFAGRFEREGQLLARLHHPNIVAVHDSGAAGGFFYLLMEFVEGVNLRQAMRSSRFTPAQALAIVPHICDALQFAHDEGVLHRDIKPENILLDGKGRVKLADFGIAKLVGIEGTEGTKRTEGTPSFTSLESLESLESLTQTGTTLGTPSYMAPEQRDTPADVDNRADIYSLGVVFYELLTGELPSGSLPKPSAKSSADPRVDAIVQQALENERTRRQHSAGEVKTQIEDLCKETPKPERPQTGPARLSRAAVVGAIWAFGGAIHFLFPTIGYRHRSEFVPYTMLAIGWSALLGATILGWVALAQIRRSGGQLYGSRLALFAGLYIPLLVIAGLIAAALRAIGYGWLNWAEISSPLLKSQFILVLNALSMITWFFIIRAASRKLCPSPDVSEKPVHPLRSTIRLQAVLFAVLTALAFLVVKKFGIIFADMGVAVPHATHLIFETVHIWGLMLFPLSLIVGASGCFIAREFGGKRGLRQWSTAVIVAVVTVVVMATGALSISIYDITELLGEPKSASANAEIERTLSVGPLEAEQTVVEIVKTFVHRAGFVSCSLSANPKTITVRANADTMRAVVDFILKQIGPTLLRGQPMVSAPSIRGQFKVGDIVIGPGGTLITYRAESVAFVVSSRAKATEIIENGPITMVRFDSGNLFQVQPEEHDVLRISLNKYDLSAGRTFELGSDGTVTQYPLFHTNADIAAMRKTIEAPMQLEK